MKSLTEQIKELADRFPIGSKVKVLNAIDDVTGIIKGYKERGPNEAAMIVDIPADTWILTAYEVKLITEK